jgi:hypothetical protein
MAKYPGIVKLILCLVRPAIAPIERIAMIPPGVRVGLTDCPIASMVVD